jgi:hypothetical protein
VLCMLLAAGCAKKEAERASPPRAETSGAAFAVPPIVHEMIAAHGGMDAWKSSPTVSFDDEFTSANGSTRASHVVVEQSRRRAYIDLAGSTARLAWDGHRAWGVNWDSKTPPRFLALLDYYFADLPWLTMDPGVLLSDRGTLQIKDDPTEYRVVLMTFEPGTGDTPHDYYRLYIDPVTKRLHACAYVVTYKALMPPGRDSTPEHLLVYEDYSTVNGLVVPVRYTIYEGDHVMAHCTLRDWSFSAPFDETRMTMPGGAVVDTTTP